MAGEPIADDEVVYCRIPPGDDWFELPNRITSANFKLDTKRHELGLSVYRTAVVTAQDVLAKPGARPRSGVASAIVGDIRRLCDKTGQPLHLDVIVVDDEDDPGHAEIRGPTPGRLAEAASKALRDLFKLVVAPLAPGS